MTAKRGAFHETPETRHRQPVDRFRPQFQLDEAIQTEILAIERAERELHAYAADHATAHQIVREALARNTFGTVSIEGNPLTLGDVRSLLAAVPSPASALQPAERDVLNIAAFLGQLAEEPPPRVPSDLERLHGALFAGTLDQPGRFKRTQNVIGRRQDRVVVYVPTPPDRVELEVRNALEWFHAGDAHPLVRVAVFFHELQSIHPFGDGNGRLGRAVAALQMHHLGYAGARYATIDFAINQDREAYYDALAATQGGATDLTPWVRYWVGVVRQAYEDAAQRFLLQEALPGRIDRRARDLALWVARRDRARPGRRLMLNDLHAAFPTIPRRTLQRDLRALVDAGILVLEGHGRGATYSLHPRHRPSQG